MKAISRLIAVLAACVPLSAFAGQLQVRYDVDAAALKEAVAGTSLTFNVHEDSSCATPPIHTSVINVEDVDTIEVLKRFTPKNAPKQPKTARIWHAFSVNPVRWRTFVSVTGTGITPVGGACQEQIAAPSTAIAASVPAGVQTIGAGMTLLATLDVDVPAAGTLDLVFEIVLNSTDVNNYILCELYADETFAALFYMDPGDKDTPIAYYDITQVHHEILAVTPGAHTYGVACNLSGGTDAFSYGAKLVGTFVEASM